MRTIIFAILVLLVMTIPTYADCGHAVVQPVVAVPVVNEVIVPVPVFVPTFQFQYQPPVCMPAAIPPAASPAVGAGMSSDENIKALARAIMEEMRRENASVSASAGAGAVEDDGPPMVVEAGAVSAAPVGTASRPLASFAILSNRCAKCHTGKLADGGFSIFSSPGQLERNLDWDSIVRAVSTGRMPKEVQKNPKLALSQAEIQTLKNRR